MTATVQKITPFLWFDEQAEEAMELYVSIFPNSRVLGVTRLGKGAPGPEGSVVVATFELDGLRVQALNGGPHYTFSPATSFVVNCETQAEVDQLWEKLSEGGKPMQCGWLTDRFGVTWQIVPTVLMELMARKDARGVAAVRKAMVQMVKLDIAELQRAYDATISRSGTGSPDRG